MPQAGSDPSSAALYCIHYLEYLELLCPRQAQSQQYSQPFVNYLEYLELLCPRQARIPAVLHCTVYITWSTCSQCAQGRLASQQCLLHCVHYLEYLQPLCPRQAHIPAVLTALCTLPVVPAAGVPQAG